MDLPKITVDNFMASFSKMVENKLSNLVTKEDMATIISKILLIDEENKCMKNKISELEARCEMNEMELEMMLKNGKRNNLIVKGLDVGIADCQKFAVSKLFKTLTDDFNEQHIKHVVQIYCYQHQRKVLLVEFKCHVKLQNVLKNCHKLNGGEIVVQQDLSKKQRTIRDKLFILKLAVQHKSKTSKVIFKGKTLSINQHTFNWDVRKGLRYNNEDGVSMFNNIIGMNFTDVITKLKDNIRIDFKFDNAEYPNNNTI